MTAGPGCSRTPPGPASLNRTFDFGSDTFRMALFLATRTGPSSTTYAGVTGGSPPATCSQGQAQWLIAGRHNERRRRHRHGSVWTATAGLWWPAGPRSTKIGSRIVCYSCSTRRRLASRRRTAAPWRSPQRPPKVFALARTGDHRAGAAAPGSRTAAGSTVPAGARRWRSGLIVGCKASFDHVSRPDRRRLDARRHLPDRTSTVPSGWGRSAGRYSGRSRARGAGRAR